MLEYYLAVAIDESYFALRAGSRKFESYIGGHHPRLAQLEERLTLSFIDYFSAKNCGYIIMANDLGFHPRYRSSILRIRSNTSCYKHSNKGKNDLHGCRAVQWQYHQVR